VFHEENMNRLLKVAFLVVLLSFAGYGDIVTVTFTADDVLQVMANAGAPLNNSTNQWGLWAVRAMPIVAGGGYTITGGSTTQTGWGVYAPNGAFGASPYTATNSAWFWDASGAEAGYPANPLYMIMDKPANTFTSYFGNTVTAVDPSSQFSFSFTPDVGAAYSGNWQFVVDGSKYTLGSEATPGVWVEDFFGGYGAGGALAGNLGRGYQVPEPGMYVSLAVELIGVYGVYCVVRRRRNRA
jgi:hypothetical protein